MSMIRSSADRLVENTGQSVVASAVCSRRPKLGGTMQQSPTQLVERFYHEVWNRADEAVAHEILDR